jgi:hypothetical protein
MLIECILIVGSLCHAVKDKPVMILATAGVAASIADTHQTVRLLRADPQFQEFNPVARPFVSHAPLAYVAGVSAAMLSAVIADRMKMSRNSFIRHLWCAPSVLQFSLGVSGYIYTSHHR